MFSQNRVVSLFCGLVSLIVLSSCGSDDRDESVHDKRTEPSVEKNASNTSTQAANQEISLPTRASDSELARSALIGSEFEVSRAPQVADYQQAIRTALASDLPVLPLTNLSADAEAAQAIFLSDKRFTSGLKDKKNSQAIRTEVMSVKPAQPGDLIGLEDRCQEGACYRVISYNFFFNATLTAIVNIDAREVVDLSSMQESQPDLSERLEQLASVIADQEPLVQQEIDRYLSSVGENGEATNRPKSLMASTKSSLRNTLCERSKHLCVAPVYVLGESALWVIVDLTDFKVVGVRWTTVGPSGPPVVITERKLENEYVFENFCQQVNSISRGGWSFDYHITTSDGLRVANVAFNGSRVLNSVKVVDWHISYSGYDRFGFSDATGCPMFSSAVVVAYKGPKVEPIVEAGAEVGFSIAQDFRQLPWPAPCNYRYEERYEFYHDGRYRVAVANHGRGCGVNGTYRPVVRIDFGRPAAEEAYRLAQWDDGEWQTIDTEMWSQQAAIADLKQKMYSHKITSADGKGYLMAPSSGQFKDNGRGDNAFIYASVGHDEIEEGERDLVTLGDCCNTDHRQGPEKFIQPAESLTGESLVLWYVPQLKNDGGQDSRYCWADILLVDGVKKTSTWPCTGGPMFVPIESTLNDSNTTQSSSEG